MDTDALPPALVFGISFFLFACLSLAHNFVTANNSTFGNSSDRSDNPTAIRFRTIIPWLKYACIIAVAISGLALLHSVWTDRWWPASLLALGLLVFLVVIDQALNWAAESRPNWLKPLLRPPNGRSGQNGAVGRNGASEDGEHGTTSELGLLERPQPEITDAELSSLDQRDREMLRSILRLDVTTAREIMTPRLDMIAVDGDSTLAEVSDVLVKCGHSRLPVYEETIDRILGVLHAREVLEALSRHSRDENIRELVRPAFIIPESKRLDDLLEELQDRGVQMAIVVDEYGGTEGLVTMEDVLEEIVGEIEDEFSRTRESLINRLPDGAVLVDAGITTEDVEALFGTRIETSDVDTVGGLVYHSLGKIPQAGDVVVTDRLRIEVISILGRRLRKLKINLVDSNGTDQ
ncbi:MAG: hypothetical protein BZY75_00330 [SAR202 cluster bacterium Io17-Chloro-G7]|nr:MAG: hypothetical protein BZY75_00330 [SAR202 cluster bacterium Io17-Chloro-G7]